MELCNPVISIIIPCYKDFAALDRLLESTGKNKLVEVVVVDDCSPDWGEVVADLQAKYPSFLFSSNDSNMGAGYSRNRGLSLITAGWVLFADSDDIFLPGAMSEILNCVRCADEQCDIIFFRTQAKFESGVMSRRVDKYNNIIQNYLKTGDETALRINWYPPWGKLIRKKIIKDNNILFDEIPASNDINFSLKVGLAARSIQVCETIVYQVTEGDHSLTKTKSIRNETSRLLALIEYNSLISKQKPCYRHYSMAWLLPARVCFRCPSFETLKLALRSYFSYFKCFLDYTVIRLSKIIGFRVK